MNDFHAAFALTRFYVENDEPGVGIDVRLAVGGAVAIAVRGVQLVRRGIDAYPQFATAFRYDPSNVIAGLGPDAYQLRLGLYLHRAGELRYDAGVRLAPPAEVNYLIPLAASLTRHFVDAPPDDVALIVTDAAGAETVVPAADVLPLMRRAMADGLGEAPVKLHVVMKVPFKVPPESGAAQ